MGLQLTHLVSIEPYNKDPSNHTVKLWPASVTLGPDRTLSMQLSVPLGAVQQLQPPLCLRVRMGLAEHLLAALGPHAVIRFR